MDFSDHTPEHNHEEEKLMDRHKIAAAFFCSFLKSRPFNFVPDKSGKDPLFCESWANEQGAFIFGMQIIQDFMAHRATDNSYSADDRMIYKNPIHVPETQSDSYVSWFVKLFASDMAQYFNFEKEKYEERLVFFIAHIYFVLERHSYQYHKIALLEDRISRLRFELSGKEKTGQVPPAT